MSKNKNLQTLKQVIMDIALKLTTLVPEKKQKQRNLKEEMLEKHLASFLLFYS